MRRPQRFPLGGFLPSLLLLACFLSATAGAQYRPPPLTEAQRLVQQADELQVEANKDLSDGDRKRAEGQFRKALALYEQALAADPTLVTASTGLGAAAIALQDYAKVVERLAPVLAPQAEALEAAYPLAVSYFKLRRFSEALPLLERVTASGKPEYLLAPYYLGSYYLYEQRGEEAVRVFSRYLQLRPAKLAGNDFQIHELMGKGWLLARNAPEARAAFLRSQQGRPEQVNPQLGLAAVLELEGKPKEAQDLLRKLVDRFPQAPEPKERLGRMLLLGGDLPRAEALAVALVKLGDTPAAHLLLGDVRLAQKQPVPAEAEFRKVLSLSPGLVLAQMSIGKALQMQGRNEEAIDFLESAVRSGASSVDLWATLGSVNRRAGRFQRAIEVHRRVVEMVPRRALGHVLLGADHFATGQWDQAIDDYGMAIQLEPQHADARKWLARTLAQRARERLRVNRGEDAVRDLRRAYDLDRSAAMARRLGGALLSQKGFAPAAAVLEQGVQLPQVGWREYLLLGYAQLGAGQPAKALAAFEQAARMTQEEAAQSDIYAGWALTQLELGEFDKAVAKLTELGQNAQVAQLTEANLPSALLRRALNQVEAGNAAGAEKDWQAAEKLRGAKQPELGKLALWVKSLIQAEEGNFPAATATLRRALATPVRWAFPTTRALTESFLAYRRGDMAPARVALKAASRKPVPRQAEWTAELARALDRREGEQAYAQGNMKLAEKALNAASAADPLNPLVQHNLACLNYRKGKKVEAVAVWQKVEAAVPQAAFNLGIDAQERRKSPAEAVALYGRYLATGGPRSAQAREWKERLQSIHGLGEPSSKSDAEATR